MVNGVFTNMPSLSGPSPPHCTVAGAWDFFLIGQNPDESTCLGITLSPDSALATKHMLRVLLLSHLPGDAL